MLSELILMKVGADPEALFWSRTNNTIIPATQFCGGRAAPSTWIGTDAHTTTLEFRPNPSKNILMVLADLATAIGIVQTTLADINGRSGLDIILVAQPFFADEPLGGHIHLSYWHPPSPSGRGEQHWFECIYNHLVAFLKPILNATGAQSRERAYTWRDQPRPLNKHSPRRGLKSARIEFRQPGTWLSSPILAYTFLGLSKLAILNYPYLPSIENNRDYLTSLRTMKSSPDLVTLVEAVAYVLANPPGWSPYSTHPFPVDFPAWQKVLAG